MTKVAAGITISLDGYITGPNDGPGRGLGDGGERLHYWVFGGPWSYDEEPRGAATGADKEVLDAALLASAQAVEHYEITRYGTLLAWAKQLELSEAQELLQETLVEEENTDELLSELAEDAVNPAAAAA